MEKIVSYLTQNAASALGVTMLAGLTVSTSAAGATKIVQSMQVKKPDAAYVKNHVVELPEKASNKAKTVILAKFGSTSISPVKKQISPTPSTTAKTQSVVQNNNTNKCIVTLFGNQYDVTPLQTGHPGGNIFSCGTDMTAIYQAQHGTNLSRVAQYLVTDSAGGNSVDVTPLPSITRSQDSDDDNYENEKEGLEKKHEREKRALENKHESEKREHQIDDDLEDED